MSWYDVAALTGGSIVLLSVAVLFWAIVRSAAREKQ